MAGHQPWRRLVFFTSIILPHWWLFLASSLLLLSPVRVEVAHALVLSPNLMDPIINHPAVSELGLDKGPRRKLKVKHMKFFQQQQQQRQADIDDVGIEDFQRFSHDHGHVKSRMNELGLMACRTGVVPRKEFLETFAAAVYINEKFPHITRFADVAAGHGLLSWFLLVLSDDIGADRPPRTKKKKKQKKKKPTAICIDRRMPGSAEKIADVMLEMYPHLKSRWCYVEADLAAIETHPTTLLVSVHACGTCDVYPFSLTQWFTNPPGIKPRFSVGQADGKFSLFREFDDGSLSQFFGDNQSGPPLTVIMRLENNLTLFFSVPFDQKIGQVNISSSKRHV
eukprot:CAMPEP_0113457002 /NCGR_PEP_ID=MMETSP0014_2-20120614/9179_1 /TAXON_ID=2857 /ORGANISM="Nitzschia sp." /LENGTH=337 /DNA_ID=CAMNT_0000348475 /DNA_START=28 /DNA_END=1041 /DNA_ORIENTATION=+ /assembly_acc=CAM_ASM_000159